MGERKGVNKYYPPDYDPKKGGLNKFQGTHALRERARKLHLGILIIRFEMPYNIWCEGCNNHIGTGVRYNAEKKKVGMYYSTPIYQFRMKCHLCDNHFEIKTDPANLDYEIVSGARRQERRWDPTENEQVVPEDKDVSRKMASDAMYKLEHGVQDKSKSKEIDPVIQKLEEFQTLRWHDDYASNTKLRAAMREKRVEAKAQEAKDASYNLSVPLLPSTHDDEKMARLLQFTQSKSAEKTREEKRALIDAQSVFAKLKPKKIPQKIKKAYARQSLQDIVTNSQTGFNTFKNSLGPQALGIVHKKSNSQETTNNCTNLNNEKNKLQLNEAPSPNLSEDACSSRSDKAITDNTLLKTDNNVHLIEDRLNKVDSCSLVSKEPNANEKPYMTEGYDVHSNHKNSNITAVSPEPTPGPSNKTNSEVQVSQVRFSLGGLVSYDLSGSDSDEQMQ